jgi:hypothetical protein
MIFRESRAYTARLQPCLAIVGLALFVMQPARATTINFDSFAPGTQPANFLAAFGIPNITVSGAAGAGPPSIQDFSNNTGAIVPSLPNIFQQSASSLDTNQIHRLSFDFSPPLSSFRLTRMGTQNFGSTDTWSAKFYNASNSLLGSFGEPVPLINSPPTPYTFNAPSGQTIARMDLESVWTAFATYRNIPVDDFVLTPAVPEPSTIALCAMSAAGLIACGRRRRRSILRETAQRGAARRHSSILHHGI